MKCDKGCGECCGIAPSTKTELNRAIKYARERELAPVNNGVTCPWYQGDTCAIYPVRPLSCRLFGHTGKLVCPKGYNVNIPDRQVHRMMRANGEANHIQHEALEAFGVPFSNSDLLKDLA